MPVLPHQSWDCDGLHTRAEGAFNYHSTVHCRALAHSCPATAHRLPRVALKRCHAAAAAAAANPMTARRRRQRSVPNCLNLNSRPEPRLLQGSQRFQTGPTKSLLGLHQAWLTRQGGVWRFAEQRQMEQKQSRVL